MVEHSEEQRVFQTKNNVQYISGASVSVIYSRKPDYYRHTHQLKHYIHNTYIDEFQLYDNAFVYNIHNNNNNNNNNNNSRWAILAPAREIRNELCWPEGRKTLDRDDDDDGVDEERNNAMSERRAIPSAQFNKNYTVLGQCTENSMAAAAAAARATAFARSRRLNIHILSLSAPRVHPSALSIQIDWAANCPAWIIHVLFPR